MNPISHRKKDHQGCLAEAQSDALAELIRHSVDLRIHAAIMLGTALLAAYCGFYALAAGSERISDNAMTFGASSDSLPIWACLAFVAISGGCLVEAHRFWRKATVIRFRARGGSASTPSIARGSGATEKPMAGKMNGVVASLQPLRGF